MYEPAQQGFVLDDADILLNVLDARQSIRKRRHVGNAADGLDFFVLSKLLGEGDEVDGTAGFGQLHHAQVDAAVRIEREVVGPEKLGCLRIRRIVEKNSAEDGPFGFHTGGQTAVKTVIDCRHVT